MPVHRHSSTRVLWASVVPLLIAISSGCTPSSGASSPGGSRLRNTGKHAKTPAEAHRGGSDDEVTSRPNVLIILTDDQPTNTLSVMANTRAWLGREGTRFTNFFVTTPSCCPSRASILTGRYAHNHGVQSNFLGYKLDPATTLQRSLQNAGYATAILGKYLTGHVPKRPPGFSEWVVTKSQRYFRTRVIDNGTRRVIERYSTTFLGDKATRFLRARESADEVPWFLLVTPRAPHFPFTPEDRYAGAPVPAWDRSPAVEELDTSDKPRWVPGKAATAKAARIRTKQLRALMSVDDLVLRLRSSLRSLGEERETLVFYLSDNGFMWGDHGLTGKNLPYSAAVKAPLLVRWPGHMEGGRSKRLVANIDLAPTIFQATRVQPPSSPIDGRSLFSPRARKTLLLEHWGSRGRPAWASLRSESFHFVQYYGETGKVIFREYYDLRTDPWELRNVLRDGEPGNDPDLKRLQRRLTVLRKCVGKACP